MPRTKLRKDSKPIKDKEIKIISDFKRKTTAELKKLEIDLEMYMKTFINTIQVQLHQFPPEIQNMTFAELLHNIDSSDNDDDYDDEDNISRDSSAFKERLRPKRSRATVSDDGYVTDKTHSYKSKMISNSKSGEKHKLMISLKHTTRKKKSNVPNIYAHTPANCKPIKINPVTPKICPNTPVSILRRPRNGETVISMGGSPLMVSSLVQEDRMANLFVPLNNGDVISLLPTGNLRESVLPTISPNTRNQLRTLKNHIEKFIS